MLRYTAPELQLCFAICCMCAVLQKPKRKFTGGASNSSSSGGGDHQQITTELAGTECERIPLISSTAVACLHIALCPRF